MNSRPKKGKVPDIGAPGWMTSYGDLMTNLVCLFVLLFSFANIDKQKFEEVARSMRAAFSNSNTGLLQNNAGQSLISLTPYDISIQENTKGEDGEYENSGPSGVEGGSIATIESVSLDIEKLIKDMGLNENIKVIEEEDIVIFRIDSLILFDSGRAELKESGKAVIEKMGTILKELKTEIVVQGHADDRPINTSVYPSNWELSTKRATNVVKYMADKSGIEEKYLTATGNAEFKPIAPNDTEYNRSKNRRVDIIVAK